jgi:hypothetical protein
MTIIYFRIQIYQQLKVLAIISFIRKMKNYCFLKITVRYGGASKELYAT